MKIKYLYKPLILAIIFLLPACSTKKNSFTRRVYHNLTAHYNVYWNGEQKLKKGLSSLDESVQDNYADILPIYKYGTKKDASSISSQMEYVIEKSKKTVRKHSMEFGGKEYVRYIDNSFLMQGQALFYKHEYMQARRKFEYVINEYKNPEKTEALLWLGRCFTQMKMYGRALTTYDQIKTIIEGKKEEINKFTKRTLPLMYAEVFLAQENYKGAIPYLLNGMELCKKKQLKTRIMFIMAQIYQKQGYDKQAVKYFKEVIKRNPEYKMSFNARIRLATSLNLGTEEMEEVIKSLYKMLKEEKNEEFRDQIYYALGEIAIKRGEEEKGLKNYRKSVQFSVSNDYQKAQSSLKVADISFKNKDYPTAKYYYDTALMVLPIEYPGIFKLQRKSYTLSYLVENLDNIHLQDSLQRLAKMPEAKRNALIDSIIKEYNAEQARIKAEENRRYNEFEGQMRIGGRRLSAPGNSLNASSVGGGWYFYNVQAKSSGYNQFLRKWGKRKLEDNWRLYNKKASFFTFDQAGEMPSDSTAVSDTTNYSTDPTKRETYLQNIPLTEEAMKESDSLIAKSLYNNGFIYKIQLKDAGLSIDSFEDYIKRYPEYSDAILVYYQLYKLYESNGDADNQAKLRKIILTKFPKSDYALIIQDPEFYSSLLDTKKKHQSMYEETYRAYTEGDYLTAKVISADAIDNYPATKLTPRFKLLKAISENRIAKQQDSLKVQLQNIAKDYPKSEVYSFVQDILKRMEKEEDSLSNEAKKDLEEQNILTKALEVYAEPSVKDKNHFYILLVNSKKVKVNAVKTRMSDFNRNSYGSDGLKVSDVIFKDSIRMITVSNLTDVKQAMSYLENISNNRYIFSKIDDKAFKHFVVSLRNYQTFYKEKNLKDYEVFFRKFYIKENDNIHQGEL